MPRAKTYYRDTCHAKIISRINQNKNTYLVSDIFIPQPVSEEGATINMKYQLVFRTQKYHTVC